MPPHPSKGSALGFQLYVLSFSATVNYELLCNFTYLLIYNARTNTANAQNTVYILCFVHLYILYDELQKLLFAQTAQISKLTCQNLIG